MTWDSTSSLTAPFQVVEIVTTGTFISGINSFFIENIASKPMKINDNITIVVATGLRIEIPANDIIISPRF